MEELEFLLNMTYLVLLAGLCSIVFNKLKLPPIIGYLLAGVLICNFIEMPESSEEIIEILSDIGLVMLMYCIGMELNLDKLKRDGKFAILVAVVQLPIMMMAGFMAGQALGYSATAAIALGAIISGSSTAVLLAVLSMQERIDKSTIETLVLVTVIEDIGQVIILSMITPLFAGSSMDMMEMVILIVEIIAFMLISIILGVKVIPKFLDWVGDNTSAEVLLVLSVGMCFLMAYLAVLIGMSMAIGAFLMGVILSQSKFHKEVGEKIEPMKDLFMAIFFIAIGMKVTIDGFIDNIGLAVILFLLFFVAKVFSVFLGYFLGNRPYWECFVCALSMTSMGEFAFIISEEALKYGVITNGVYMAVIGAAILSMVMVPITSRGMFPVIDYFSSHHVRGISTLGNVASQVRADVYTKLESEQFGKKLRGKLKNSYVCIVLIVIIEILFVQFSEVGQEFLFKMIGIEYAAYVLFLLINFFVLAIPTATLVLNLKFIERVANSDDLPIKVMSNVQKEGFYRRFNALGVPFMVCVIDFLILAIVPGPFGTVSSLVIIPIVLAIGLGGIYYNRRKDRKAVAQKLQDEAPLESSDAPAEVPSEASADIPAEPEEKRDE